MTDAPLNYDCAFCKIVNGGSDGKITSNASNKLLSLASLARTTLHFMLGLKTKRYVRELPFDPIT